MRLLLASLCVVVVGILAVSSSAAAAVPKRINVTGSTIEISNAFLAWRIKDSEGTVIGIMTIGCHSGLTNKTKVRQCNGTMALPKGKIHFSGQVTYNTIFSLTVIGGNGIYSNIRGVFVGIKYAIGVWKMDVYFR